MVKGIFLFSAILLITIPRIVFTQTFPSQQGFWHHIERQIHYRPEGKDFVLVNGNKRFNRALYGTNTAFRVEAGDRPEFALYMPGMGGNLKLGIISGSNSKWLIEAGEISARYRPGSMIYDIKDPLLGNAILHLTVLACADREGFILKASLSGQANGAELFAAFGGATGRRFERDGDIGTDAETLFSLQTEYCRGNLYDIKKNKFKLTYGNLKAGGQLVGVFPSDMKLKLVSAEKQNSPIELFQSVANTFPVVCGRLHLRSGKNFFLLLQNAEHKSPSYSKLHDLFNKGEQARESLVNRVRVTTPDAYINAFGGALAVAADAIWEAPSYLHGAVAWRTRFPGWRGAYVADPLGWHDRARSHFGSYASSQVLEPENGPVAPDTALHLARQLEKMGTSLFSSGYISPLPNDHTRASHYDMNLVFIDQLLNHFDWTGDISFARQMWPVIKRHLAWEKRNFDSDGNGLYDSYAAIWASDALQYSGGDVTHSSAYNYRANLLASRIATLIGDNPTPYRLEAEKIRKAINTNLWIRDKGWFAEYKDLLGVKLVHPYAGLWTVYHTIDSKVADKFQAFQATRYVDSQIPHIPVKAVGLNENNLYLLSTTNWQPYTWSVNNVALAEVLHMSLAYWQANRPQDAFRLWRSALIESMYLSSSPGGFEQLSFYDAQRGELYRDFADPIGVAARTLVEGLFGIHPDAFSDTLTVQPGLPSDWKNASLQVPDISFEFSRQQNKDVYLITPTFKKQMDVKFVLPARSVAVHSVRMNGEPISWKSTNEAVGSPSLEISAGKARQYHLEIEWEGILPDTPRVRIPVFNDPFNVSFEQAVIENYFDPQSSLSGVRIVDNKSLNVDRLAGNGNRTIFIKVKQRNFSWWVPVALDVVPEVGISFAPEQTATGLRFSISNNAGIEKRGTLRVNSGSKEYVLPLEVGKKAAVEVAVPPSYTVSGTNHLRFEYGRGDSAVADIINWNIRPSGTFFEKVNLQPYFNDKVTSIFKNKYLSPRPSSPTLQIPWQGVGNWCAPLTDVPIDDSGIRRFAWRSGQITLPTGIPLATPGKALVNNIIFTSKWSNYPDSVTIPLAGHASHAYFMMAGSTNPMQSRIDNGEIVIYYTDNSSSRLALRNPDNWWPIEQDYYVDEFAFTTGNPLPYRVYLKSGIVARATSNYIPIKGFTNRGIDGGAATVLDLRLEPGKELKALKLKTIANETVIGLMSITLAR